MRTLVATKGDVLIDGPHGRFEMSEGIAADVPDWAVAAVLLVPGVADPSPAASPTKKETKTD